MNNEKSIFDWIIEKDKQTSGTLTTRGQTTLEVADFGNGKGVAIVRMGERK
jgi:hypothetical protein